MPRNMTFKVGDVVFPSGAPTCLGKVVDVRTSTLPFGGLIGQDVRVKWRRKTPRYVGGDWIPSHHVVGMEDYIKYREGIIKRHKKRLADMKKWVP